MPIALLLQSALAPLSRAGPVLDRWQAMLRLEALVVARARSAFVVHWFGPRLASSGRRLLVSIQNVQALAVQYRQARAASVAGDTGPNLAEPLASLAGMGVGLFLSPSGAVLTLYALLRTSLGTLGSVLLTITHSLPMMQLMTLTAGGLLLGIGLPVAVLAGIGYALYVALSGDDVEQKYELLGDFTRMLQGLTRFIGALTGPREAIRNPLLKALLGLVDAFAALLAQMVGALAILLSRVLPLIAPNLNQFAALRDLALATVELVKAILTDAWDALRSLYSSEEGRRASPWEAMKAVFRHAGHLVDLLVDGALMSLAKLGQLLGEGLQRIRQRTEDHLTEVATQARRLIADMPLARTLRAVAMVVDVLRTLVSSSAPVTPPPPPPSSPPGSAGAIASGLLHAVPGMVQAYVGTPPPVPDITEAALAIALRRAGLPVSGGAWGPALTAAEVAPFELDPATRTRAQELLRSPHSVFSGERAALRAELGGKTPEQALEALRSEDLRYRDLLYAVVTRVLPPHIQGYLPQLRSTFEAIDEYAFGHPTPAAESAAEWPVRTLPDNGRLRPQVHRLVLRSVGGDETSLRGLAVDLQRLMREQSYWAPDVAPV